MLGRKTLLVNPPLVNGIAFTRQGRCQEREEVLGTTKPPYTLAVIASLLRAEGCDVRLVDLTAERGTPADLIVGHSWGGAAAIVTASQEPTVRAVVTVGAPSDPSTVEHQYDAVVDRAVTDGHARWLVGGKALTLKRTFVEDVRSADLLDVVPKLRRPLLVMHSPTDDTVDISNAADIFTAARHPRSFVSLEGSDHLLTAHGQAARAARIIGAWAEPYLTGVSR